MIISRSAAMVILTGALLLPHNLVAAGRYWMPVIRAQEPLRSQIADRPIDQRPNRPFHFYGNTVRRIVDRGNPLPNLSDLRETARAVIKIARRR